MDVRGETAGSGAGAALDRREQGAEVIAVHCAVAIEVVRRVGGAVGPGDDRDVGGIDLAIEVEVERRHCRDGPIRDFSDELFGGIDLELACDDRARIAGEPRDAEVVPGVAESEGVLGSKSTLLTRTLFRFNP